MAAAALLGLGGGLGIALVITGNTTRFHTLLLTHIAASTAGTLIAVAIAGAAALRRLPQLRLRPLQTFYALAVVGLVGVSATIAGRQAIQQAWQLVLGSGAMSRLTFEPKELDGLSGEFPVETGTLVIFDKDGKGSTQNNYLLVWKREEGAWKIYRDIANQRSAAAPTADRVGFPKDYRTQLKMLSAPTINPKLGMVQTAYGNEPASTATLAAQLPYPYGSVLVMEFAQISKDAGGKPLLESDGQPQRGPVFRVDVMRREPGFGEAYGKNRAGEWEFVSYRVDGGYFIPPGGSASCAECHSNKAGAAKDFVFPLVMSSKN
jgi:ketosteroid isomerase-like protein